MYKDKKAFVETLRKYKNHILGHLFTEAADTIEALMTEVEAKRDAFPIKKPGNWIFCTVEDPDNDPAGLFRHRCQCSVCGDWQTYGMTNYCPSCGAEMEVIKYDGEKEEW